ncbi:MAG: DUF2202 domain-containing protein [Methanoregulaceae archaeon]
MQKPLVIGLVMLIFCILGTAGCTSQQVIENQTTVPTQADRGTDAGTVNTTSVNTTSVNAAFLSIPASPLNASELNDVIYLQEAEKAERDLFQTFSTRYNSITIFSSMATNAAAFMKADDIILSRYNISNPEEAQVGVFANQKLQHMYDAATNEGSFTLENALQASAMSEDMHIADLSGAISRTDNQDLAYMYGKELSLSRNDLRLIVGQIQGFGGNYTPVYITADSYNAIISSPIESLPQS